MTMLTLIVFDILQECRCGIFPPFLCHLQPTSKFYPLPDIGGGSWMFYECCKANTGFMFNSSVLQEELGMDLYILYPYVTPCSPPLPLSHGTDHIRNPPTKEIPIGRVITSRRRPLFLIMTRTLVESAMKDVKSKVIPPLSEEELHNAEGMVDC